MPRLKFVNHSVAAVLGLAIALTALVGMLAGRIGQAYLDRHEALRIGQVALERSRSEAYRREIQVQDPVDQNAAIWYRRSFSRVQRLPKEDMIRTARAVADLANTDVTSIEGVVQTSCGEARSERIREALRCTKCDWGLALLVSSDNIDSFSAWQLGNCMVLIGRLFYARGEFENAAEWDFNALSYACDLGRAEVTNSLVGMSIAKSALLSLGGGLAGQANKDQLLNSVRLKLARFEMRLPRIDEGLRLSHLRTATNLEIDARTFINNHAHGLMAIIPWPAVAAWRLSRYDELLKLLLQLADASRFRDREGLAARLDESAKRIASSEKLETVPSGLVNVVKSERQLDRVYRATQAAIELEAWYFKNGSYPSEIGDLSLSIDLEGLSYKVSSAGQTFEMTAVEDGRVEKLFGRPSLNPKPAR